MDEVALDQGYLCISLLLVVNPSLLRTDLLPPPETRESRDQATRHHVHGS
jgi:hypothetical protein